MGCFHCNIQEKMYLNYKYLQGRLFLWCVIFLCFNLYVSFCAHTTNQLSLDDSTDSLMNPVRIDEACKMSFLQSLLYFKNICRAWGVIINNQ